MAHSLPHRAHSATCRRTADLVRHACVSSQVRVTKLLSARERPSAGPRSLPLYEFEYRVDYPGAEGGPPRQQPTYTVCVVGASSGAAVGGAPSVGRGGGSSADTLFTFASRVPASRWEEKAAAVREVAASFVLY